MKIVKTNLKFKDLDTAPFAIETSPEHIKLHTVCVVLGKRAAGKSFFVSNLMAWLEFDRILIISPTYESNYAQFRRLGVAQDDIFDPDDPQVIQKVVDIVNAERDDLFEYRQKLAMLKELKEVIKNPWDLSENYHLFSEFIGIDGNWIEPEHKWNGRKPKIAVFVDDAQSTRIFRNRQFLNCVTTTRVCSVKTIRTLLLCKTGQLPGLLVVLAMSSTSLQSSSSKACLLYTSPSPRDQRGSRMPSSA